MKHNINKSIQKYPHITETYTCILKTFVTAVDLSIHFLISFRICSTPKLSKLVTLLFNVYKAIQWVALSEYSSRFTTIAPSFILLGILSLD